MTNRNYDTVKEAAMKYDRLSDFRKNDRTNYVFAYRHGWLKDFTWLKKQAEAGYYTYDVCKKISSDCSTRSEFYEKNKSAYRTALHNGWLDKFTWLRKPHRRLPRGFWSLERTKLALRVCSCYKELVERFPGARCAAQRFGIYDLLYTEDKEIEKNSDLERCLVAAIGSRSKKEMREYFPNEYATARKNGWLDNYKDFWI